MSESCRAIDRLTRVETRRWSWKADKGVGTCIEAGLELDASYLSHAKPKLHM